jgi:hypothetical protein
MSFPDRADPRDPPPDRLNLPAGANILRPSVEANLVNDLCTAAGTAGGVRARILTWLADGPREVAWALCSLPRERWAALPPPSLGTWPVLRHARYLALREVHLTVPSVRLAVAGDTEPAPAWPSPTALAAADAAWDAASAVDAAEAIVRELGETRFELLQTLEAASEEVWARSLPPSIVGDGADAPVPLAWLLLQARQYELTHLAAIWRVALNWDRVTPPVISATRGSPAAGVPLHPADRLEESH